MNRLCSHLSGLGLSLLVACGEAGTTTDGAEDSSSSGTTDGAVEATSAGSTAPTTDGPTSSSSPTSGPPGPVCGDGLVDPGEECDDGDANGDGAACTSECKLGAGACVGDRPIALLSRSPAGQGTAISPTSPVLLEFPCSVDRDTVNDATIAVHGSQSGRRAFSVEWSDNGQAELVFAAPLFPGERVDVTLTAGIHDMQGGALAPQVFHFTVSGAASAATFTGTDAAVGSRFPALGDLDGDGDIDIVRSNGKVYLNEGGGVFTEVAYEYICAVLTSGHVTLADVDSDRDLDILCMGGDGVAPLWLNDGAGAFTKAPLQEVLNWRSKFVVGDVDGDGDLDVFAATRSTDSADGVLINDGTGVFSQGAEEIGGKASEGIALGDVDGDGDLDVVYGNGGGDDASVWLNDGTGQFAPSGASLGAGPHAGNGVDVGDVNGDGTVDVLVMPYFSAAARIWTNSGAAVFTEKQDLMTDNVKDALLRDLDGDGDLDVVSANDDFFVKKNLVWLNAGDGSYTPGAPFGGGGEGLAVGDLDGDGVLDVVASSTLFRGH